MNYNSKYYKDDETISRLVQSVRINLPQEVDKKLAETLKASTKAKTWNLWPGFPKLSRLFYPAAVLAGVVLLLVVFGPWSSPAPLEDPITEIRTEFEIKDKNIKIIWFQKKDFKLRRNTHES